MPMAKKQAQISQGHTPRGHTPKGEQGTGVARRRSGHQRAQTAGFGPTGADLTLPRKDREDFRKALVNLVM